MIKRKKQINKLLFRDILQPTQINIPRKESEGFSLSKSSVGKQKNIDNIQKQKKIYSFTFSERFYSKNRKNKTRNASLPKDNLYCPRTTNKNTSVTELPKINSSNSVHRTSSKNLITNNQLWKDKLSFHNVYNINEIDLCEDVSQSMETFNILVYKNLDTEYNFIRDKKTNIKNRQKFKLYNVFKVNDNGIKMKNDLYKKLRGIKLKLSKYKF